MAILVLLFALIVPTTPAFAIDNAVSITKKECKRLIRMHSVAGADYVPGRDVRGNKVKGADLGGGSPIKIPKEITFDIGIDLAEKYGFDDKGLSASATFGKVKVKGNKVFWNGQQLNRNESDAILEACRSTYDQ